MKIENGCGNLASREIRNVDISTIVEGHNFVFIRKISNNVE